MIGRTNATVGELNMVNGTFKANQTSPQTSFTVTGLMFEPKYLFIIQTANTSGHCYGIVASISNYVDGTGVHHYDSGVEHITNQNKINMTDNGGGSYTFTTALYNFGSTDRVGTYTYYIFG